MSARRRCFLCDCKQANNTHLNFHKFPADANRKLKWIKVCSLRENDDVSRLLICSRHFAPSDFIHNDFYTRRHLKETALPCKRIINPEGFVIPSDTNSETNVETKCFLMPAHPKDISTSISNANKMSTNCCVCLDTTYITTLNEKDNFNESLLSKILVLVPEVKWSGELKICLACLEELNSAYDFRKKCLVNSNDPRSLETYAEPRKRKIKQKPQDNYCKTQPIIPVQHVQNKGVPFIQLQIDPLAQQNVKTEEITIEDTILSEVIEEEPQQPEIISLQIVPDGEETSQMEQFFDASTQDGNDIRYMYECEVCHAIFERKQPLIDHCVQSHNMDQLEIRPFACKVCPKKFLSLCNLKNHVLTHTEIRSYICDVCNKGFKRAYDLKHHKDTLHNTKRYGCKACKKFFTTRSNLKKHIVSQHMDASKFNHFCNVCGKRFVQGKDQVIHVFRYHGKDIDELKCYDCEIRFNTKQELVNHMRTHKDIWHRHQCPHCENKYKNPAGLRKHLRKVHFINQ